MMTHACAGLEHRSIRLLGQRGADLKDPGPTSTARRAGLRGRTRSPSFLPARPGAAPKQVGAFCS